MLSWLKLSINWKLLHLGGCLYHCNRIFPCISLGSSTEKKSESRIMELPHTVYSHHFKFALQNKRTNCKWVKNDTNFGQITGIQKKLDIHVNRMPWNRLPSVMKYYSTTGRRNHGRPLKRLLDTWDRNGSTGGPTPWQMWWWWWWWWFKFHTNYTRWNQY